MEAEPSASAPDVGDREQLLREALLARAQAEAAQAHTEIALGEAHAARALAEAAEVRQQLLARTGRAMATSMDARRTLEEVAQAAIAALADWCMVSLVTPEGTIEPVALAHADPARRELLWQAMRRHPPRPDADVGIAQVVRSGELQLLESIDAATLERSAHGDEEKLRVLLELAPRAILTVPLATPTRVLGAISFVFEGEGAFPPEDVVVATSLAARVALYVQNTRLYAERSHIADTLQRSLLPPTLPQIPGVELAVAYRAAGEQFDVGGDFYDVFRDGEGDWIAFVGDVCGKGAEAAALTSLTRHTLFAAALRGGDPLASVQLANDALRARSDDLRFATLAHARLRPLPDGGAEVLLTVAGHPPPLVLRRDGTVEEAVASGMPVGIVADPTFDQQRLTLAPGELLLLYSDGVIELRRARRHAAELGETELRATLAARAGCSAASVVEAVERRAVELQDGQPRDDIALLAIRAAP